MIGPVKTFLDQFLKSHPDVKGMALEVGSLDVNGNVRDLLGQFTYIASDMRPGNNVDVVVNGHNLVEKFGKESMDLVICFDTLEHDDKPWLTVEAMREVLKPGGWLLITVPSIHHPRHDHPFDYYRYFATAIQVFLEGFENVDVKEEFYFEQDSKIPDEVLGFGQKPL